MGSPAKMTMNKLLNFLDFGETLNWLKRIFGLKTKNIKDDSRTETSVSFQSDQMFDSNEDILLGSEFAPPLLLSTSLEALEHYGEIFSGRSSDAPSYGGHNFWLPKVKDEFSLFTQEPTAASDIGPVKPSYYVPLLICFRRVIESERSVEAKLKAFSEAVNNDQNFAVVWEKWKSSVPDFPHLYLGLGEISEIPGVGRKTARILYSAGYTSKQVLRSASAEDLESLQGIGQKTATKIIDWLEANA